MNGRRRITIKDIALQADVSIGTVDRVLHNRGEVNILTRERVMACIRQMGYRPNLIAKSLSLRKRIEIAALIPESGLRNPYWEEPARGMQEAAVNLNDHPAFVRIYTYDQSSESSFARQVNHLFTERFDGLILAPHFHFPAMQLIENCRQREVPVVLIDSDIQASTRLAYIGQEAATSGAVAARLMHFGFPAGKELAVLNLAGNKAISGHMKRRCQGFLTHFEQHHPDIARHIKVFEMDLAIAGEPAASLDTMLESHPLTSGIFVTNSRVSEVAEWISSRKMSGIRLAGYDLIRANRQALEEGFIDFLICQRPREQGYRSVTALFYFLLGHDRPEPVHHTAIDIVVKENLPYYVS